jgi:hypothetical protein
MTIMKGPSHDIISTVYRMFLPKVAMIYLNQFCTGRHFGLHVRVGRKQSVCFRAVGSPRTVWHRPLDWELHQRRDKLTVLICRRRLRAPD